jgi:hypothetical protein
MEDAMKKMTRAFQLDPMPEDVELHYYPRHKKWYANNGYKDGHIFIMGHGYKKMTKTWKHETVKALPELTAEGLKAVADKYGINGALAMVRGWGAGCLLNDNSYGLTYAKFEVANMATLGKAYDEFTDAVQTIGDCFIEGLEKRGFKLDYKSLWYNYIDSDNFGSLVGFCGVYERIKLHPLLHVDHSLHIPIVGGRILPMFNPMSFDTMLESLFYHRYGQDFKRTDKALAKYVSVYDRIKHLAGAKAAKGIEKIFELQKTLDIAA